MTVWIIRITSLFILSLFITESSFAQVFNTLSSKKVQTITLKIDKPKELQNDFQKKIEKPSLKQQVYMSRQNVCLPLKSLRINSSFGYRVHPITKRVDYHRGIDLAARSDPVFSIVDGIVAETGYNKILGNYVRINHNEIQTIFGHLSFILVEEGSKVLSGQTIGITGSTGRSTGEHLHFSVKFQKQYINPLLFLVGLTFPVQQ